MRFQAFLPALLAAVFSPAQELAVMRAILAVLVALSVTGAPDAAAHVCPPRVQLDNRLGAAGQGHTRQPALESGPPLRTLSFR